MTPRIIILILFALVVLVAFFLTHDALDSASESKLEHVHQWGRPAAPYVIDESMFPPVTARARTAPSKRTTMRAASASAPVRVYPVGELQDMIRAGFARFGPDVAEQAVRVAGCESTGDPTGQRLNPRATNGSHSGLFQLSRTYHEARARRLGFTWEQMLEPEPNIAVAADLFAESAWGPWTCRWAA